FLNSGARYCAAVAPTPTASITPTPTPTLTSTPSPTPAQLINLSTRLRILTDANVGIAGVIILGTQPKQAVFRGIGPSLANFGVPDPLADPVLELHGPGGFTTVTNDNWMDDPGAQQIQDLGLAPSNPFESATIRTLNQGNYTEI